MKTGLAIWHYPQRSLVENAAFFLSQGFQSVSALGLHFYAMTGDTAQSTALCDLLDEYDAPFTVHHKLPDPDNAAECENFFTQIDQMLLWQKQYGHLNILSFDTWYDRERLYPYLLYAVKSFRDSGTKICCEDYPICSEELEYMHGLEKESHVGLLIDLGHMNLRLHEVGDAGLNVFQYALDILPLPIYELHIHANDGEKDLHDFLHSRASDLRLWAHELKVRGFDGIATIESVPPWQGLTGPAGDEAILHDLHTWEEWWG